MATTGLFADRLGLVRVDRTDWLKAAALIFLTVDHVGLYFMEADDWWRVIGRLAAPIFFFLIGYARSRRVPLSWIGLGLLLTVLDAWGDDWQWSAPNILLNFALLRLALPTPDQWRHITEREYLGLTLVLLLCVFFVGRLLEYGAEGWLWALFGLCQRTYDDYWEAEGRSRRRFVAAFVAAAAYLVTEPRDLSFDAAQTAVLIVLVAWLAFGLLRYHRGISRLQPPRAWAPLLRFVGRRTLGIYAAQLILFEILTHG
ncbi:MAG: hypothetical protein JWL62_2006 [Hyphomicrobiales bacterium]|nr:hypothetical protein [Hyphomicrobiales bacterium]